MIDKAQQEFEKHCSEYLNLDVHLPLARDKYHLAFDQESVAHKKHNAGVRAMNLYLLQELKKIGCEGWRKDKDGKKPPRRNIKAVASEEDKKAVAYKSKGERPKGMGIKLDW